MQINSPYGKPINEELETVYGLDGPEAARDCILRHVHQCYAVGDAKVEQLEISFGLSAKIKTAEECFYLKFTSQRIHRSPEQLFPWLNYARTQGVPVPEVVPCNDGNWFKSPLPNSCYDVVYLMREIPGIPISQPTEDELRQYALAMAHFHEVGSTYPHQVAGRNAGWNNKLTQLQKLLERSGNSPLISTALLATAWDVVQATEDLDLPTTIIHGDFRFCHVFFDNGRLTGLIDVDTSTTGERWVDYCYGLLSGNRSELGNFLNLDQIRQTLNFYHERLPLNAADQLALKATFSFAAIETLFDVAHFVENGATAKNEIESLEELLNAILQAPDLLA